MVVILAQSSITPSAVARHENSSTSSSSSCPPEWNDATNGFCHVEPGYERRPVAESSHHSRSPCAVISGPLIALDMLRRSTPNSEPLKRRDSRARVDAALDQHNQRLPRELVSDVEQLPRTVAEAAKAIEISEQTYRGWRNQYGGIKGGDAKAAQGARAGERATEADRC